jgi:hypothetical protein
LVIVLLNLEVKLILGALIVENLKMGKRTSYLPQQQTLKTIGLLHYLMFVSKNEVSLMKIIKLELLILKKKNKDKLARSVLFQVVNQSLILELI